MNNEKYTRYEDWVLTIEKIISCGDFLSVDKNVNKNDHEKLLKLSVGFDFKTVDPTTFA